MVQYIKYIHPIFFFIVSCFWFKRHSVLMLFMIISVTCSERAANKEKITDIISVSDRETFLSRKSCPEVSFELRFRSQVSNFGRMRRSYFWWTLIFENISMGVKFLLSYRIPSHLWFIEERGLKKNILALEMKSLRYNWKLELTKSPWNKGIYYTENKRRENFNGIPDECFFYLSCM